MHAGHHWVHAVRACEVLATQQRQRCSRAACVVQGRAEVRQRSAVGSGAQRGSRTGAWACPWHSRAARHNAHAKVCKHCSDRHALSTFDRSRACLQAAVRGHRQQVERVNRDDSLRSPARCLPRARRPVHGAQHPHRLDVGARARVGRFGVVAGGQQGTPQHVCDSDCATADLSLFFRGAVF